MALGGLSGGDGISEEYTYEYDGDGHATRIKPNSLGKPWKSEDYTYAAGDGYTVTRREFDCTGATTKETVSLYDRCGQQYYANNFQPEYDELGRPTADAGRIGLTALPCTQRAVRCKTLQQHCNWARLLRSADVWSLCF